MDALANPDRDIRLGSMSAALFFVGFLGWAAFARLDAATYATGTLVVTGQRQVVQHREGGVVNRLLVREGERVHQGQLLMTLADAEVVAQERVLSAQAIRLLAQRSRLEAEQLGADRVPIPIEYSALSPSDKEASVLAMKLAQSELNARLSVLSAQHGMVTQRVRQSNQQGRGYREQSTATAEQLRLIDEQIEALRPIADNGFVSKTRMRELERQRAELVGRRGQLVANVAQTENAARESELHNLEVQRSFQERTGAELRDVENSLSSVLPKWTAARDQRARMQVRAPVSGEIVGLTVYTQGGVVAAGQKLMDIVPGNEPLIIEARISPDDADDLILGQRVRIKFAGLHERTLPNLEGRLQRLSADSFTDDKTGQSYFSADVSLQRDQLKLIQNVRGAKFLLRAGMPVQVLIPLRQRSALDYALEPLIGSFWSSFREH